LGRGSGEVLQRHLVQLSIPHAKTLTASPIYDVLLPITSQMIRNCKTLKISLPDLLLNYFTASPIEGGGKQIGLVSIKFEIGMTGPFD
jgi:hypothetical protein